MPNSRSLVLILPEIDPAWSRATAEAADRWPQLARLAGRGSLRRAPAARADVRPWQLALLEALGLEAELERYPSAAVTRSGELDQRVDGFWMHATPMHLAAGLERLTAQALQGDDRLSHAEAIELEPALAAHLRLEGCEMMQTSSGGWLVRSDHRLEVQTATPDAALALPLEEALPRGRDAGRLRRLMTELQMVLHAHAVNARRLQRGLLPVNAVWLHGAGALCGSPPPAALPQACGTDPYLRGIYRLNDREIAAAPLDARALLRQAHVPRVAVLGIDGLDALEALWLVPLMQALARGRVLRLELVLERWRITIERMALLRFWQAARAPAQWREC